MEFVMKRLLASSVLLLIASASFADTADITLEMLSSPDKAAGHCFVYLGDAKEPLLDRAAATNQGRGTFTCLYRTHESTSTKQIRNCEVINREGVNQPQGAICKTVFDQPGSPPTLWIQMNMNTEMNVGLRCSYRCTVN
jgi:hypothetical protein